MIHMERLNLSWLIETLNISLDLINSFLSVKFIVVQWRCWESITCHGNWDEEEIGCYFSKGMKQLLSVCQLQQLYQGNCIKAPTDMPVWYVCRNSPWQWKPLISSRRLCSSSSSLPAQRVIWNHKFLLYPQKSIWFCRSLDGLLCCTPCSCSTKSFQKMLTKKKTSWKPCRCNSGQTSRCDDKVPTVPPRQRQGGSERPRNQTNPSDLLFPEEDDPHQHFRAITWNGMPFLTLKAAPFTAF